MTWLDKAERLAREAQNRQAPETPETWDTFVGPCVHGRDPFTRCGDCMHLMAADARALAHVPALAAAVLAFRERAVEAMAAAHWSAVMPDPWDTASADERRETQERVAHLLDRPDTTSVMRGDAEALAVARALGLVE
mgnify:FL=1